MAVRTNLIVNPSIETATSSWAVGGGTGGTAAATSFATTTPTAATGSKCLRLTWSVGTTSPSGFIASPSTSTMPATVGKAYTWSAYVRSSKAQSVYLQIVFKDAGQAATLVVNGSVVALAAGVWTRVSVTGTAPANTAFAQVWVVTASAANGGVNWAAGDTLDMDGALLEEGGTVGAYFDGATPDRPPLIDYGWTGTAHASASTETDTSAVVTVVDKTPTRLRLQVTNPGGHNIGSIVRTDPNGTRTVRVEAGVLPTTAAGLVVNDYEYPLLYRATIVYTVYSVAGVALGSLTIDAAHSAFNTALGMAALTVPLRPAYGLQLNNQQGGDGSVVVSWDDARAARHTVHTIVGRPDPVVILHQATTRTGTIEIVCPDLATAQLLERTLALPYVFDLRQSDQSSLDLYFVPSQIELTHGEFDWTQAAPGTGRPERRWILTVRFAEVGCPSGYVVPITVWTWNDVVAAHTDWNALGAIYSTWANVTERIPG